MTTFFVKISNQHSRSIDLTSLIADSAYGITTIYPQELGESNRLEPGAKIEIPLEVTSTTTGLESLVIVGSEAEPHELARDFSFLEQERFSVHSNRTDTWRGIKGEHEAQSQVQWQEFIDSAQSQLGLRGEKKAGSKFKNHLQFFQWVTQ